MARSADFDRDLAVTTVAILVRAPIEDGADGFIVDDGSADWRKAGQRIPVTVVPWRAAEAVLNVGTQKAPLLPFEKRFGKLTPAVRSELLALARLCDAVRLRKPLSEFLMFASAAQKASIELLEQLLATPEGREQLRSTTDPDIVRSLLADGRRPRTASQIREDVEDGDRLLRKTIKQTGELDYLLQWTALQWANVRFCLWATPLGVPSVALLASNFRQALELHLFLRLRSPHGIGFCEECGNPYPRWKAGESHRFCGQKCADRNRQARLRNRRAADSVGTQ